MMKNYYDTLNWIHVGTQSEAGITVEEYLSEDNKWLKQIWNDGYVEIHSLD